MAEIGHIYAKRNGHLIRLRWDGKGWVPDEPIPAPKAKPFRPMLAKTYAGNVAFPVIAQPKLDGVRCIARKDGLFSRDGNPITTQPHIEAALAPLFAAEPDLVLDGELWLPGTGLADIAKAARYGGRALEFHVFDLVSDAPCQKRLAKVAQLGVTAVPAVVCADQSALDEHYRQCLAAGYEGQMIRDPEAGYRQTRCGALLKRKPAEDAEAEIIQVEVRDGGNLVAHLRRPDGVEFLAPVPLRKRDEARMRRMAPHMAGLEATYRFTGLLPSGAPRDPVVKMIHEFPRM